MNESTLICDLQFGSTGKGLIAGYMAKRNMPDVVVTAWSPNAGHTFIDSDGRKFVHTMLANGVVSPNLKAILIGPGSVINVDNLITELNQCNDLMGRAVLVIHPNAAVVNESHRHTESQLHLGIGSTMKGSCAANVQKMMRDSLNMNTAVSLNIAHKISSETGIVTFCSIDVYNSWVRNAESLQIEGAQGFSLSIHHGIYPYVTSRDCTPAQIASDCAIPADIFKATKIIGCLRTYPIRVANRHDDKGALVGYSGPCYPDQEEITFDQVGVDPELTTVTKLPRRIFTFSKYQLDVAVNMCSPDEIFLNFANYTNDEELAKIQNWVGEWVRDGYIGRGATESDVERTIFPSPFSASPFSA